MQRFMCPNGNRKVTFVLDDHECKSIYAHMRKMDREEMHQIKFIDYLDNTLAQFRRLPVPDVDFEEEEEWDGDEEPDW